MTGGNYVWAGLADEALCSLPSLLFVGGQLNGVPLTHCSAWGEMFVDVRIRDLVSYMRTASYPCGLPDSCPVSAIKAIRLLGAYLDISDERVRTLRKSIKKNPYCVECVILTFMVRNDVFFETEEEMREAVAAQSQVYDYVLDSSSDDDDDDDDDAQAHDVIVISDDDESGMVRGGDVMEGAPPMLPGVRYEGGGNGEVLEDLLGGAMWLDDGFIIPEN